MTQPNLKALAIAAALCAITLAAYWPGARGPFLLDDLANIQGAIVGSLNEGSLADLLARNHSGIAGRPVSMLTFWWQARQWGLEDAFAFKWLNIILHLLTGAAVFLVSRQLAAIHLPNRSDRARGLIASTSCAIWLLHPLQVSTTLYVVQRMAQFSALFSLLAIGCFLAAVRSAQLGHPASRAMAGMAGYFFLTLLAILSKETGALVPALALAATLPAALRDKAYWQRASLLRIIGITAPLVMGLLIFCAKPGLLFDGYAGRPFGPTDRLATETIILWDYVKVWLIPAPGWMGIFVDDQVVRQWSETGTIVATLAWASIVLASLVYCRRSSVPAFVVLWFLLSHAMESTILPLELKFEHRNYLASVGLAFGVASLIDAIARRASATLTPLVVAASALTVGLALLTHLRAEEWSSPETLYSSEYVRHPDSLRANQGMQQLLQIVAPNSSELEAVKQKIVQMRPGLPWARLLGAEHACATPPPDVDWETAREMLMRGGSTSNLDVIAGKVIDQMMAGMCANLDRKGFRQVLESAYGIEKARGRPSQAEGFASLLGWTYRADSQHEEANRWFETAAKVNPAAIQPLFNLAYFHLNQGNLTAAASALAELRQRQSLSQENLDYRIDELADFVEQAKSEASGKAVVK